MVDINSVLFPGFEKFIENWPEALVGSALGAFIATFMILAIIFSLAFYVYHSLAWMRIAQKQKYKHPWLAWIPIGEWAMRLSLGKISWKWIFLVFLPIIGWIALLVLVTIATWRIFEAEKYPAWLGLSYALMLMPRVSVIGFVVYMISIGLIAWREQTRKKR
ncbi:hypothetical protein FJZ20_00640 [Candidatus Pacearchaeota archaeon]|nr:hypothetical protein [Candidatus Pacearchaeota archaeon]